jgi:hypothetical protein
MSGPTTSAAHAGVFSDAESTDEEFGYDSQSDDVELDGAFHPFHTEMASS